VCLIAGPRPLNLRLRARSSRSKKLFFRLRVELNIQTKIGLKNFYMLTRDYRTQHRWAISRDLMNQATYFKLKSLMNILKIQLRIVLVWLEQLNLLHIIFRYILNKTSYWSDLWLSMLAFKFKLKLVGSILNNYPITYSYSLQVHRKGLWNLAQVCLIAGPRPLNLRLFWAESLFKEPKVQV